jgi:hypothetical protein
MNQDQGEYQRGSRGAHLSFCTPVSNNFPSISQVSYYEELKNQSAPAAIRSLPANSIG